MNWFVYGLFVVGSFILGVFFGGLLVLAWAAAGLEHDCDKDQAIDDQTVIYRDWG